MIGTIANATLPVNSKMPLTFRYRVSDDLALMSDPNESRLAALKAEISKHPSVAAFARAHPGMDETYIRQLLSGYRNFGERAARKMGETYFGSPDHFAAPQHQQITKPSPIPRISQDEAALLGHFRELDPHEQARLLVDLEYKTKLIELQRRITDPPPAPKDRRSA